MNNNQTPEHHDNQHSYLSPAGQQRREVMLSDLLDIMQSTHNKRRIQRKTTSIAIIVIIIISMSTIAIIQTQRSNSTINNRNNKLVENKINPDTITNEPSTENINTRIDISIVHTQSDILTKYTPSNNNANTPVIDFSSFIVSNQDNRNFRTEIEWIDDDNLLATLASMNRPTGLIRTKDSVRLTNDVVDKIYNDRNNDLNNGNQLNSLPETLRINTNTVSS